MMVIQKENLKTSLPRNERPRPTNTGITHPVEEALGTFHVRDPIAKEGAGVHRRSTTVSAVTDW
jgi:hypothetical protein